MNPFLRKLDSLPEDKSSTLLKAAVHIVGTQLECQGFRNLLDTDKLYLQFEVSKNFTKRQREDLRRWKNKPKIINHLPDFLKETFIFEYKETTLAPKKYQFFSEFDCWWHCYTVKENRE